jgi:membrane protease YdiL (CAAX protease family)
LIAEASAARLLAALVLAGGTALVVERLTEARGYLPPGFLRPWRRVAALAVLCGIFFVGIFLPVVLFGLERPPLAVEDLSTPGLFLLQGLLVLSLAVWFLLGYAVGTPDPAAEPALPPAAETVAPRPIASGPESLASAFARQLGLRAERPLAELGLGLAAGAAGWVVAILLMLAVVALVWALGGQELLPTEPPELIPWIAGLSLAVRIAIAVTAGVVEELFFRGFLQPRAGIALSSALFVLAHLSYEQPFMLVGIAALSLLFAWLVRWRGNVLAAIVAHATFDLIQLLIVVPQVLKHLQGE